MTTASALEVLRAPCAAGTRDAELRVALTMDSGRIGVFERGTDDRLVYADAVVRRLIDLPDPAADLPLERFLARVLPEDREAFTAARRAMRRSDLLMRCDYQLRGADGSVRDVLSWRRRRLDADGRYAGEIGILFDATELRAAERRARNQADWLELAAGGAGMCAWEYDGATRSVLLDAHGQRLFEGTLPPSPIPCERIVALLDAGDVDRCAQRLRQAEAGNGAVEAEVRLRLPSGARIFAARAMLRPHADGRSRRIVGMAWDVTENRAAEAAARATGERLRLATESAGIGCWQHSLDGRQIAWDAQAYQLMGATPADGAPAQILQRCVHPEDVGPLERARLESLRTGRFSIDFRICRGDGEERWLASRGRRYDDGDGVARCIAGVTWDITETRMAEAALRARETAERANLAKSEFLSRMSHELRTPMNAIVGFTQLLELDRDDPLSPTQRERVGLIRNAGWHLLNLINDVLDLARIEAGRAGVSLQMVDWRAVLEDALAMLQPQAAARGIVLESRSAAGVADAVWCDPARLRQVFLNLLANAIKYSHDNGSVLVGVQQAEAQLVFAVRDNGQGMTARQRDALFEPFSAAGTDAAGLPSGIGLAITQRLLQQMEGTIEVDSTLGAGSEFRVRLRAAPPLPARTGATAPAAVRAEAGPAAPRDDIAGTVLCIEDNPANAALVEQLLHLRSKVNLYQAADGATGLVMAAVCRPDLILIDMRLPDMTGDEVLRALNAQRETAGIRCVAVSADAMPRDIAQARAAGFVDYWTKPLDAVRFLDGIDALLRRTAG